MIKAIFSDLEGVIRHWNNDGLFALEAKLNLPTGFLFERAFHEALVGPAITGKISHEAWVGQITAKLNQILSRSMTSKLIKAWSDSTFTIDTDLIQTYQTAFPRGACQARGRILRGRFRSG